MGLFGPRRLQCPAETWTTLIDNMFVQMPKHFEVRIDSGGLPVEGLLEEKKSDWIIPGSPRQMPLAPAMTLYRGWFNTFYRVRIYPRVNVVVTID